MLAVLFIVAAAVAATFLLFVVLPRLRLGPGNQLRQPPVLPVVAAPAAVPRTRSGLICPACGSEYPDGLKYCPNDARSLVPVSDPVASRLDERSMKCPICRRSFEDNKRFCPYDTEELVAANIASNLSDPEGRRLLPPIPHSMVKICPHCGQRYEGDATFCGRDGSELVNVN
ncbi:MAG TPA: hypothetical protein VFH73_01995 [Polyangia bacterium]|jgi:predicted amidophosphoribosyltransferase|nr:hypothetical protein [Polyangia bacterium]